MITACHLSPLPTGGLDVWVSFREVPRAIFQADNRVMEGTEELKLGFQLERGTQNAVSTLGNVFFRSISVQINDTTGM